ncbi:hypothetical protein G6F50_013728 [Rhizopus delemar]|uniref:Uncharacterized protein n=1 Tax=Rhizopus delemar TaxID=936053 RepID=A0A9P6YDH4_9FUNG|nr:hypothetical protein G6F50_013728 [Rhizopus delemar]
MFWIFWSLADVGRIVVVGAIGNVGDLAFVASAADRHFTGRAAGTGLPVGAGVAALRADAGHRTGTQCHTVAGTAAGAVADRHAVGTCGTGLRADRHRFGTGRGCSRRRRVRRQVGTAAATVGDALVEDLQRAVHRAEGCGDVVVVAAGEAAIGGDAGDAELRRGPHIGGAVEGGAATEVVGEGAVGAEQLVAGDGIAAAGQDAAGGDVGHLHRSGAGALQRYTVDHVATAVDVVLHRQLVDLAGLVGNVGQRVADRIEGGADVVVAALAHRWR